MWKGADSKKTKTLTHEEIKKQLIESILINEVVETDELISKQKKFKTLKKHQGKVFKKFKDKQKFITLVSRLGIYKNTIIFKINVFKLCERHPKLLKSSIGLGFFKNYHKDIKQCFHNYLLSSWHLFN